MYVRVEPFILGLRIEYPPGSVQRGNPRIATACDVDCAKVEWQTQEVVLQRPGYEFVNLIATCSGNTAEDRARGLLRRKP